MMHVVIVLLLIQGALGAFDVFYNHEWEARLPSQASAALELKIHAVRAVLYAVLFAGIAWFEWHGVYAYLFAALILVEILLTLWDFVVEDRTRKLSALERVTHTVLAMNGGAYVGLLFFVGWTRWVNYPDALVPAHYGISSWILSVYAVGVFFSGLRDGFAGWRHSRALPVTVRA